jgi:CHAT domain-containing protein
MFGRQVTVLKGPHATVTTLREKNLSQYRYIVFATHGILDSQIPGLNEPALVMSQVGKLTNDDGFLTMNELMDLRLDAEVSALVACDTGRGRRVRGEGVMGLGRAFQYAGSQSVLVSLWPVDVNATIALTEGFFRHLKAGSDPHVALRSARRDVRKVGYEHPFYWAAFILIGG